MMMILHAPKRLLNLTKRFLKASLAFVCAWVFFCWTSMRGAFRLAQEVFRTDSLRSEAWNYEKIVPSDKLQYPPR